MNLTREQMLAEMGITPLWKLRTPSAGQGLPGEPSEFVSEPADLPPPADLPAPKDLPAPADLPAPGDGAGRAEAISRLDWTGLRESAKACRACGLCEQRRQAVVGVGDLNADWLFIGEGPGADEDAQGEPFVGQAGKLLDNMLGAIDLKRDRKVYIANAVKCRPPGNRTPTPDEMAACRPYLERQIDLIRPKLIVLLGKAAASTVLGQEGALGALRGRRFEYRGVPVVVTYHPAYLLRNLPEKAKAWEDLVFARKLAQEQG